MLDISTLELEKFDVEAAKNERWKPFDRLSFDPVKNHQDSVILNCLRKPGRKRLMEYAEHLRRDTRSMDDGSHMGWLKTPCVSWSRTMNGGGVYVDAGCGESPDADLWLEFGGAEAYAYDLCPRIEEMDMGETDRLKPFKFKRKSIFVQQDICERWPNKNETVDAVGCHAVLDLLRPNERLYFYKEAYRVLKVGGVLTVLFQKLANGHGLSREDEIARLASLAFDTSKSHGDIIHATKLC